MDKRLFLVFALFAAVFAIGVPLWTVAREGSPSASPAQVATDDQSAKLLFQLNCGSCHILARAGTDGVVGPDLDDLLGQGTPEANQPRVLSAIEVGRAGRMPAGILRGLEAEQVADFVARVAGR